MGVGERTQSVRYYEKPKSVHRNHIYNAKHDGLHLCPQCWELEMGRSLGSTGHLTQATRRVTDQ